MIYQNYQWDADVAEPVRNFASVARQIDLLWMDDVTGSPLCRMAAYYEQIAILRFTHVRPEYEIEPVQDRNGMTTKISEKVVLSTPFCDLIRFRKDTNEALPKLLLVAPMSGHFATLLKGTVQALVQDHEVYLTDWLNIRDVPLGFGELGLDE